MVGIVIHSLFIGQDLADTLDGGGGRCATDAAAVLAAVHTGRAAVVSRTLVGMAPGLKVGVASFAGTSERTFGVEASMLIQGDHSHGVGRAKDIATASAVVTSGKQMEVLAADWSIAGRRGGVGLRKHEC